MLPKPTMTLIEKFAVCAVLGITFIPVDKQNLTFLQFIQQDHITPVQRDCLKIFVQSVNGIVELKDDVIKAQAAEIDMIKQSVEALDYKASKQSIAGHVTSLYEYKELLKLVRS